MATSQPWWRLKRKEIIKKTNFLIEYTCYVCVHVQHMNAAPKAVLHIKPTQSRRNVEEYTPNLNKQLLAVPEVDGMLSVSNLGWESKPSDGAFEELGASVSVAGGSALPVIFVAVGLCLVLLKDFSVFNPSLSSSASLEDKPYDNTANGVSCQSFQQKNIQKPGPKRKPYLTPKSKWLSNMSSLAPKYFASAFANISWYISDPVTSKILLLREEILTEKDGEK